MIRHLLLVMPLALCACTDDRPGRPPLPPRAECRAGPVQRFVGLVFRPALAQNARRVSGARAVRAIRPGMAVTMDYRTDRLNIEIDAGNRVVAMRCG